MVSTNEGERQSLIIGNKRTKEHAEKEEVKRKRKFYKVGSEKSREKERKRESKRIEDKERKEWK